MTRAASCLATVMALLSFLFLPISSFASITSVTFPSPAFRPPEGPQPPLPTAPLSASQAALTFLLNASPGDYRAVVKPVSNSGKIVATVNLRHGGPIGRLQRHEITVPLEEGDNSFIVTVQDTNVATANRSSGNSPILVRDLLTSVSKITLDAIQPPTRSTSAVNAVIEFTLNGTAANYQIDVVRNAVAATTFTTDRVGVGRVTVPLTPNTANDFFLRATANDRLAIGNQVSSNIVTIVSDRLAPTLANVSVFPGPSTGNTVVNVVGQTEPFSKVSVDNGGGKVFTSEADLAGNFVILGVALPFLPPGPTLSNLSIRAIDAAGNRSAATVVPISRVASEPRFEFLELSPPSGSLVAPGTPIHVRGSVGERSGPFTVTFFIRQTTGTFQIEERIENLGPGAAFEKDIHLVGDTQNPDRNVIYSVEAQVTSTSASSPRQLVGEVIFDASDPDAPEFDSEFDPIVVTNSPKITANGSVERFATVQFNAFPGILLFPSSRILAESTPIILGGEFRNIVDISRVLDGVYTVRATAVASSGRFSRIDSVRELSFQRDTVAPMVASVSINGRQASSVRREFFAGQEFVTLRIQMSEAMATPPEVLITQRGSFALPASLTASVLPDEIFEYTYVTLGGPDFQGPADVIVTGGMDRAGNPVAPETRLSGLFFVDTLPPVLDPLNTRPLPGTVVSSAPNPIFISILENPASILPASGVDIQACGVRVFGPLETDPLTERTGFVNVFSPQTLTFVFDEGQFVKPGTYQIRVNVADIAGNTDTVNLVYKLKLDPISQVFVTSTVPGDGAILAPSAFPNNSRGQTVLSATISSVATPELDLARSSLALEQACPAVRPVAGTVITTLPSTVQLVLDQAFRKDGSDDGQYLLRVLPRDIAGNVTPNIIRSFVVDTQPPAVQAGTLLELGRFGNTADDSFFPARGQSVTGPLRTVRAIVADGVARNGYPGSGPNSSLTTGSTVVLTLLERHPTTLAALPAGSSTTNNSLLTSVLRLRDIIPPVTSPCYTGVKRATLQLELRIDPLSGRPLGLTTGGDFDGRYEIAVTPVDQAGNRGLTAVSSFIYDTLPPRVLSLDGITNGDVFTGRAFSLEGTVADNDKSTADNGLGIDRVVVSVLRADSRFVTTGAPLVEPTTATLSPNVRLVQAETVIKYRFSTQIPSYSGNAILLVEAYDVAGNRSATIRQFTIQNRGLERPILSAPPHETSTAGPVIAFRWSQVPGASSYLLTLTDPNGNAITRTTDRATPELTLNLDQLIEGRYSWTVSALDTSGQPGQPALAAAFTLDVSRPQVREVFAFSAAVPDAHAGEILGGQIRVGVRYSETMDQASPPVVTLRPANPKLSTVNVRQISYDNATWRGIVDIQPDPASPDFNGIAILSITGAKDVAGNVMEVTSSAFEVDVGPYWQVRAFANPIQRSEILFHIKALTNENGVPEKIEGLPLLTVTQPGAGNVAVAMRRLNDSVFAGVYTVNQSLPGNARLAITGSDARGNGATRLLDFSVTAIIAANRNRILLPKAGSIDMPPGSAQSNATLVAFGADVAGEMDGAIVAGSPAAAALAAGLVPVAPVAAFLPEAIRLNGAAQFTINLDRFPAAAAHPTARLGLYRLEGGRYRYQPGRASGRELSGALDGLSRLELMADLMPPRIDCPVDGKPIRLESDQAAIRVPIVDDGSGIDPAAASATLDGKRVDCAFDSSTGELTITPGQALAAGNHDLVLEVADQAGNKTSRTLAAHSPGHASITEVVGFPNPARAYSSIRYRLSASGSSATIRVFDAAGFTVFSAQGPAAAGVNELSWPLIANDGSPVASGVYVARIKVDAPGSPPARATVKIAVLR